MSMKILYQYLHDKHHMYLSIAMATKHIKKTEQTVIRLE